MCGRHKDRYTNGIAVGNEIVYLITHCHAIYYITNSNTNSTLTIDGALICLLAHLSYIPKSLYGSQVYGSNQAGG